MFVKESKDDLLQPIQSNMNIKSNFFFFFIIQRVEARAIP